MDGSTASFLADTPYLSSFAEPDQTGILYIEDFDAPPEPAASRATEAVPEPPRMSYTEEDLAAAREAGVQEGLAAAITDALALQAELQTAAQQHIADALLAAREQLERVVQKAAQDGARALLAIMQAAVPATMAKHGLTEVQAVVRALAPGLRSEPEIRVRAHPVLADHVRELMITMLPPELCQIAVVADPTLAMGDIQIAWENGTAQRDCAAIWAEIQTALAPLGLPALEEICCGRS